MYKQQAAMLAMHGALDAAVKELVNTGASFDEVTSVSLKVMSSREGPMVLAVANMRRMRSATMSLADAHKELQATADRIVQTRHSTE